MHQQDMSNTDEDDDKKQLVDFVLQKSREVQINFLISREFYFIEKLQALLMTTQNKNLRASEG